MLTCFPSGLTVRCCHARFRSTGISDAVAAELDAMLTNSTLLVDQLEHEDDSIFKEHRIGRVAGSRSEFGTQRLLAESSAGNVNCKLLECLDRRKLQGQRFDWADERENEALALATTCPTGAV